MFRISSLALFLAGTLAFAVLGSGLLAQPPKEQKTVVPPGSEAAGKTLFVERGCYQCHTAGDVSFPPTESLAESLFIELGTQEHRGWSRDDYARAIMNPNHTVSPDYHKIMIILGDKFKAENSPMPGFNDILTVNDLIHLTTFLDSLSN